jgi:hypothetical protein
VSELRHPDMHQHSLQVIILRLVFVLSVRGEIELLREFQGRVDFLVLHDLHVKYEAFQMDDQVVGTMGNRDVLHNVSLLLADITVVVGNALFFHKSLETFLQTLLVLDIQGKVIELFVSFFLVLAFQTGDCIAGLSSKDAV